MRCTACLLVALLMVGCGNPPAPQSATKSGPSDNSKPAVPVAKKGDGPAFNPDDFKATADWLLHFAERERAIPTDNEVAYSKAFSSLRQEIESVASRKVRWSLPVAQVKYDGAAATVLTVMHRNKDGVVAVSGINVPPAEAEGYKKGDTVTVEADVLKITHNIQHRQAEKVFVVLLGSARTSKALTP